MAETLTPDQAPSWVRFVTNFDTTYKAFMDNYQALMSLGPYIQNQHPELLSQYEDMLQRGSEHAYTLQQLKATRDTVAAWLQWLQAGAINTFDWFKKQVGLGEADSGLGYVPVIVGIVGVAAASAALVIIASWIKDAYMFAQRLNALQAQEARGATPAQAAAIVNSTMGAPGSNEFLGIPWTLLAMAAIAVFIGPPLLKMLGERK